MYISLINCSVLKTALYGPTMLDWDFEKPSSLLSFSKTRITSIHDSLNKLLRVLVFKASTLFIDLQ